MKLKLFFLLLIFQASFAQQRTCGTDQLMEVLMNDPVQRQLYIEQQNKFEVELQKLESGASTARNANVVIRIPVAVHYPTAGTASAAIKTCLKNLAQRQVNILNADYNGTNADISSWEAIKDNFPGTNSGSLNVQFVIATQNHPAGTGLNDGDLAVTFGTDFLGAGDRTCTNGCNEDITWSGYMNLVVTNLTGGILGFSRRGGSPAAGMTVVIDNNAFGATLTGTPTTCTGYAPVAPYNRGRTLTHELGHFFNLDHTFGPVGEGNGCVSSNTDNINDTPQLGTATYGCPAFGTVFSCDGGFALTMNYMDYVNDACMYMFTAGQATRMQAWYNSRANEFTTTALANEKFLQAQFNLYPNPNKGSFTIEFKQLTNSYSVEVFDVTGKVIYENNYDQAANLTQVINLNNPTSGIYFVNIKSDKGLVTKKLIIE